MNLQKTGWRVEHASGEENRKHRENRHQIKKTGTRVEIRD